MPIKLVEIISQDYLNRRKHNPQYSLRSYSRFLGINSGALSQIISGKRPLTLKQAYKIVPKLNLSHKQRKSFLEQALASKATVTTKAFVQLKDDEFAVISEWYHYAILNLMDTIDFKSDDTWIASRLDITTVEARQGLARLERLELIKKVNDKWIPYQTSLTTTHDIPNAALKHSHEQTIDQAKKALWDVAIELRDISSISMATNTQQLIKAKEMIKAFRRKLSEVLETGDQTEVYALNIQLFPITKIKPIKVIK